MNFLLNLLLTTIAVYVLGQVFPGVTVTTFGTALCVAVLLRIANTILRPLLFILTLPINVLTLGLFSFVIMGMMIWLISQIVPGFIVTHFSWATGYATSLFALNWVLAILSKKRVAL